MIIHLVFQDVYSTSRLWLLNRQHGSVKISHMSGRTACETYCIVSLQYPNCWSLHALDHCKRCPMWHLSQRSFSSGQAAKLHRKMYVMLTNYLVRFRFWHIRNRLQMVLYCLNVVVTNCFMRFQSCGIPVCRIIPSYSGKPPRLCSFREIILKGFICHAL